jgi:hypothetical protein
MASDDRPRRLANRTARRAFGRASRCSAGPRCSSRGGWTAVQASRRVGLSRHPGASGRRRARSRLPGSRRSPAAAARCCSRYGHFDRDPDEQSNPNDDSGGGRERMSEPRKPSRDERPESQDTEQDQPRHKVRVERRTGQRRQGQRHDLASRRDDQDEAAAQGADAQQDLEDQGRHRQPAQWSRVTGRLGHDMCSRCIRDPSRFDLIRHLGRGAAKGPSGA